MSYLIQPLSLGELGLSYAPGLSIVICLSLILGTYLHFLPPHRKPWSAKRYVMPPGPSGWPLVGNLVPWLRARNGGTMVPWLVEQAKHGEMTTLSMGTKTVVLLNSARAVNEIISKRASLTHERPDFPIAGGLVSRNRRFFLLKTADLHDGRRLIHRLLMGLGSSFKSSDSTTSSNHASLIEDTSLDLLRAYLDEPTKWYQHNYRYPLSIIYKLVTGHSMEKSAAELDDLQLLTSTFLTSINSSFVDFFPQLATSGIIPRPFQLWRHHWEAIGEFQYTVMRHWWEGIKAEIGDHNISSNGGNYQSSFVKNVLNSDYARQDIDSNSPPTITSGTMSPVEERAMYLVQFVINGGADNPRMTTNAFVMACLSYPQVMRRGRADIDHQCGSGSDLRLPTLEDLPHLPYMCAVVKEVLRWRPTVPLMPQRVLVEDMEVEFEVDGEDKSQPGLNNQKKTYRFPKGTEFLVNTIPVCTNGYDDPGEFRPERWLSGKGKTVSGIGEKPRRVAGVEQDLWQFAFSAGRRACGGYRLAQKELFVAFSRLLYCFDFDSAGTMVDDRKLNAFAPGEPFPVRVIVRSAAHERLIRG